MVGSVLVVRRGPWKCPQAEVGQAGERDGDPELEEAPGQDAQRHGAGRSVAERDQRGDENAFDDAESARCHGKEADEVGGARG